MAPAVSFLGNLVTHTQNIIGATILKKYKRYLMSRPYLLTPWRRVHPEKLKRPKLLKKFAAFYKTRRFIAVFTIARHLSLSWARLIQSIHPIQPLEDPF
jgi:hypothetical protein